MIFISSLILSRTYFSEFLMHSSSQGCLCHCDRNLPPPPSLQLIIQCLTEASASCSTKRHMKHFSKTLENHLPKRKRLFSSRHHYQQTDTNVELKSWQFFRSLVTGEMKPITTSGYSISIQTSNASVLMGLNFYLWPWPFGFLFFCLAPPQPYSQLGETGTLSVWDSYSVAWRPHILRLYGDGTLWQRVLQAFAA